MKLEKFLHRKTILITVFILLGLLLVYFSFNLYGIYTVNRDNYVSDNIDAIKQRMDSLFLEINDFPRDEGDDILYLGKMNSLNKFINADEGNLVSLKKNVEDDFYVFMEVSPVYYQLRYIDESGLEIVRINRVDDDIFITPEKDLKNKRERYYFEKAMELDREEIYVSSLDLNIENNVIENRGTAENPEYVPVIRYAMPVFNTEEERKGIIVFNVYADYFLEDVRRLRGSGEETFLIDNNGYYLAHPNKSKEFSFMFGGEYSISSDYGRIGNEIIKGFDKRFFENDEYVFTFRHLYPTIGTFEIYKGSKKILGEDPAREYYWVLISVSEKEKLNVNIVNMRTDFVRFFLVSVFIIFIIIILLLIILVMNGDFNRK